MQRAVPLEAEEFAAGVEGEAVVRREGPFQEAFIDVVRRLGGRVDHVFGVEAVVPEFVQKEFVGREIRGVEAVESLC